MTRPSQGRPASDWSENQPQASFHVTEGLRRIRLGFVGDQFPRVLLRQQRARQWLFSPCPDLQAT